MIIASLFMIVAIVLITTGVKLVSNSAKEARQMDVQVGEAANVAQAGLVDALGWFRRKNALVEAYTSNFYTNQSPSFASGYSYVDQPFQPVYNATNPQNSDTMDAYVGLVNEFPLDAKGTSLTAVIMGRYEVPRQADPFHPNATQTATPYTTATRTSTPNPNAVHDITGQRITKLLNGDGLVWLAQSTGYVYKRMDHRMDSSGNWIVPYNQSPNKVLATARMATEFRKMTFNLPTDSSGNAVTAAVYAEAMTNINIPTDQALLFGSNTNSFAAASMDAAVAATLVSPVACQYDATSGGESSPITQGTVGGVACIYSTNGNGSKSFTVTISSCGVYKMTADVRRSGSSNRRWDVAIQGVADTQGVTTDTYSISGSSNTWYTEQDVTGGSGTRNWSLPAGTYTVVWSGNQSNAYLKCFSLEEQSVCPPCPTPVGSDSYNTQGSVTCGLAASSLDDTTVFGMNINDLKLISDYRGDSSNDLIITSDWKLSYFDGNLTYGASQSNPNYQRLDSNGILIVNGDLTLNGGNGSTILASSYGGIIFVLGNLTVNDGSELSGAVIMGKSSVSGSASGNTLTLNGSGGNKGTIYLNYNLVQTAMQLVAQYRENTSARKTLLAVPNL
ncbi:MAG TPA: hypothetical protein VHE12_05000 [bacterium]|nr:hypothetical protein [bacterium]